MKPAGRTRTPKYRPRVVDEALRGRLRATGAVLLEGPKACGKTSTARQQAASEVRLDADLAMRRAGLAEPSILLQGPTPRLIDEWQRVPAVWDAVRAAVDDRQRDGQFILTGSATPSEELTRHSGAMRVSRLRMRPMSLFESGDSTGTVSLAALLAGKELCAPPSPHDLAAIARLLCRGGWPASLHRRIDDAQQSARDYLDTIAGTDITQVDGIRRDPRKVLALLFSLARHTATYTDLKVLAADATGQGAPVTSKTISTYLDPLLRLWVVDEQLAWGGHLRSAAQARSKPKRHLVDPSLAAAALGADPSSLLADREMFGFQFESLVYRDLCVYADAFGGHVRAYRDDRDVEVDAVVVGPNNQWMALEVKLSGTDAGLDLAAKALRRFGASMRTPPAALGIVVATGPTYRRPDGVIVISLGTLGP